MCSPSLKFSEPNSEYNGRNKKDKSKVNSVTKGQKHKPTLFTQQFLFFVSPCVFQIWFWIQCEFSEPNSEYNGRNKKDKSKVNTVTKGQKYKPTLFTQHFLFFVSPCVFQIWFWIQCEFSEPNSEYNGRNKKDKSKVNSVTKGQKHKPALFTQHFLFFVSPCVFQIWFWKIKGI
jgi:isoprenylcysteine carboxyl methyltransferase (ICMT) family protein YpbQ